MTPEEKKFLKETFKAGEYTTVTIMVKNEDVEGLVKVLQGTGMKLVVIPSAKPTLDFVTAKKGDKVNN